MASFVTVFVVFTAVMTMGRVVASRLMLGRTFGGGAAVS